MTRTPKTPRQWAEENLAAAERRLKRADDLVSRLGREYREAGIAQDEAKARRDYAAKDPALATKPGGVITNSTTKPGGIITSSTTSTGATT